MVSTFTYAPVPHSGANGLHRVRHFQQVDPLGALHILGWDRSHTARDTYTVRLLPVRRRHILGGRDALSDSRDDHASRAPRTVCPFRSPHHCRLHRRALHLASACVRPTSNYPAAPYDGPRFKTLRDPGPAGDLQTV